MKLSSHKLQRESRLELSMTSMIDVVFLLLIFFMTSSSFMRTERELDSGINVDRQTANEQQSDFEPAIVDIVRSNGDFVFRLGAREFATQQELTRVLRQFENKVDGAFVRVSDDAPFDKAAAAIQACKSARFLTVFYVPLESDR
jgi:biopolymer transport protein ExbD